MRELARCLAREFSDRQIVLLEGAMGAGKTQLVKFLLEEEVGADVCSPSFSIHNSYETAKGPVEHLDLFRLENEEDLESTGFWDLFSLPKAVILIEWSDRLADHTLPPNWTQFKLEIRTIESGTDQERRVMFSRTAVKS